MKNRNEKTYVIEVFESYPLFYQPYIPPLLSKLKTENNFKIKICAFKGKKSDNVDIIPSYYNRIFKEKLFRVLNRKLPKLNYFEIKYLNKQVDIIHIQHSFLFSKVLGILKMNQNIRPKIVITLRGADTYIKPWINKRWIDFYKEYGNQVDAFVVMSNHQKQYLKKWTIDDERIHVIPISFGNSINTVPKYPNSDKIKLISAFRMCWEKNIDSNIRTVKELIDKGYNVQYDIYGDGPDVGQVYYLINRYNLENYVFYKGKIKNTDFKNILSDYDFYLQLSASESAGATVIEAQSKGVPCIISNSDGMPEMIINEQTGYSITYFDAKTASNKIIELHDDREKYYEFSKNAIEFVNSKFTIEQESKLLLDLYKNILN